MKKTLKTCATLLLLSPLAQAQSITEGFLLSDYRFDRFKSSKKSEKDKNRINEVVVCVRSKFSNGVKKGITLGKI